MIVILLFDKEVTILEEARTKLHPLWEKLWQKPYYPLEDLALCGCLMDVVSTKLEEYTEKVPWVGLWTGPVNAAWNCPFCLGSGLDEDRLVGGLLRILGKRIWLVDRLNSPPGIDSPSQDGYRIHFLHDGQQHNVFGETLLATLLVVYEAVSQGAQPVIFHEPVISLKDQLTQTPEPKCAYCGKHHSWGVEVLRK